MRTSCLSAVPSDLLLVSTPRQIPYPYSRPAQLCHNFRQAPKGARRPLTLWHFKQVQQRLTADALQPVKEVNFAAHAFQYETPWIRRLCRGSFSLFFFQSISEPQRSHFSDFL
jgi:hypothetical protein